jgi:cytochrome d ubiquinol oxidase subunit II
MLADVPIVLILVGLAAYAVLAGADFGAGFWTLFSGGGRAGHAATREHAHHAMGPVWEANHVWLILVLVVCWTAYPVAFGSIMSTLSIPLFIAALGIILRGTSYALRGQLDGSPAQRAVERVFALSSILTPFALGTVIGGIAAGRVPVGNAKGDLVTSWLNPTAILIGALTVAFSSYLAAVYLAADAHRLGERDLERDFRARALAAGVAAGALAFGGLLVVREDTRPLWDGLTGGAGLAMVCVSAAAGILTLTLVRASRFGLARASAALAVAAIVAGWAAAQEPRFLPGLTIEQAAAGRSTLITLVIAVAAGGAVVLPSLALLFHLFLRGQLVPTAELQPAHRTATDARPAGWLAPLAGVSLLAGSVLMVLLESGWAHVAGVLCLFTCAAAVFVLAAGPTTETIDSRRAASAGREG